MKTISIGCMPFKITEAEIKSLFVPYGVVHSVKLYSDMENAEFDSYAHVEMDEENIKAALEALDGRQIGMKYLRVHELPVRRPYHQEPSEDSAASMNSTPFEIIRKNPARPTETVARDVRRFEFMAKHLWSVLRRFNKVILTPRCQQCTISSHAPGIELIDGLCNKCRSFNEIKKDPEETRWEEKYLKNQCRQLHELLQSYQGRGKGRYDALMLYSGGKDSSYLLYKLHSEYPGLRILLTTWDNGFYSQIALETAQEVARRLDIEHIIYKPKSSVFKSLYRYTLTHVNEHGSYGTVDRFDGTLNQHLGMKFAAELQIPLVISGVDWAQAMVMGSQTHFEVSYEELTCNFLDGLQRRAKLSLTDIFSAEDAQLYWNGDQWPVERIPRYIAPLIAWRPDTRFIAHELTRLGLVMPGHTSPLITNNEVLPLMTAIDIVKLGYCSFEPEFSDMVRLQHADPLYWRNVFELSEYLVRKNLFLTKSFLSVLEQLNLTTKDVGL